MPKTPRHLRRSRSRIARYADADRAGRSPAERYDNAVNALQSALANTRGPGERAAAGLTRELRPQVTELLDRARLPARRVRLYRDKLDQPGTWRQQLGQTLMCLKGACRQLPESDRDAYLDHYAAHLLTHSRRIETEGR